MTGSGAIGTLWRCQWYPHGLETPATRGRLYRGTGFQPVRATLGVGRCSFTHSSIASLRALRAFVVRPTIGRPVPAAIHFTGFRPITGYCSTSITVPLTGRLSSPTQ